MAATRQYRPLRLTEIRAEPHGGVMRLVRQPATLNPTGVSSVASSAPWQDPFDGTVEIVCRVVLKDRDEADLFVAGTVEGITEAWEYALRGGPITPAEWGFVAPVPEDTSGK